MTVRITRRDVECEFLRFVANLQEYCGWTEEQARGLALDYNPHYGGMTISANEGSTYPTGGMMTADRVPLSEMSRRLRFFNKMIAFKANGMRGTW